ncbi:MAG: hypothetical protein IKC85_02450, partial [Bacteroidaceae bacterium]|nr:hypothetical protein [Bacteroidaceae bacterium]
DCTSLVSLTLPASVVSVEEQAFRNCTALAELSVEASAAPMCKGHIADAAVYSKTILSVPVGCVGEYGFARIWEQFHNIVEHGTA